MVYGLPELHAVHLRIASRILLRLERLHYTHYFQRLHLIAESLYVLFVAGAQYCQEIKKGSQPYNNLFHYLFLLLARRREVNTFCVTAQAMYMYYGSICRLNVNSPECLYFFKYAVPETTVLILNTEVSILQGSGSEPPPYSGEVG